MEQHTLYRRNRTLELAWFPCRDPKPGQRLTITKFLGLDLTHETIWYHPDDWTRCR